MKYFKKLNSCFNALKEVISPSYLSFHYAFPQECSLSWHTSKPLLPKVMRVLRPLYVVCKLYLTEGKVAFQATLPGLGCGPNVSGSVCCGAVFLVT